ESVTEVARRRAFGSARDDARRLHHGAGHPTPEAGDEIVEGPSGEGAVGLGDVLAAPEALVRARDRRFPADVVAEELDGAGGLLVFEVARPVGERVPGEL